MAKKKNDQGLIADLLSKLKASYSEDSKKPSKRTKEENTGDDEFQEKLRQMLGKTDSTPPPKKAKSKKEKPEAVPKDLHKPASDVPTPEEPTVEEAIIEEPIVEEPVVEEPVVEEPVVEETTPAKPKKPRKARAKKEVSSVEPTPVILAEPVPEVSVQEATVAEDPVCAENTLTDDDPAMEKSIAETSCRKYEPVVDLDLIAEAPAVEGQLSMEFAEDKTAQVAAPTLPQASSQASAATDSTIVIKPQATRGGKQIVIAPPGTKKATPKPIPQEESRTSLPQKTIHIGKEAAAPMSKPTQNTPEKKPTPAVPSVKQITIKPPTVAKKQETKPSASPVQRPASPAVQSKKAVSPEPKKSAPPRPHILPPKKVQKPQKAAPVSEKLDQALETDLSGTLYGESGKHPVVLDPHSKVPLTKQIQEATGLDEDDLHMLFTMGYESELSSLIGARNLTYLKSQFLQQDAKKDSAKYPHTYGYTGSEYTGENSSAVLSAFRKDAKRLSLRSIFTALLTFLLLFLDLPYLLGTYSEQLHTLSPYILPLAAWALLLGIAAFSFRELKTGLSGFVSFSPTHYSPAAILIFFVTAYDLLTCFTATVSPLPVNLLTAILLLSLVLCDLLDWSNQIRTFRILSAPEKKTVLEKTRGYKRKMRLDDRIVQILNDSEGKNLYRVAKTDGISGAFRRTGASNAASRPMNILITLSLSVSVLGALGVAVYTKADLRLTLFALISLLLTTIPMSAAFSLFYPLFHTNRLLARYRCTLVGDESVEEYSRKKTVIFEDTDLLATEKCSEINLEESADIWPDLRLATALFSKIGPTLSPISTAKDGRPMTVNLLRISENGVEATVNNHHLLAGDARFLNRAGIDIPADCRERALRRTETVGALYVAIDGVLKLCYEVEYTTRPSFEKIIESLAATGTEVAIRSYDPNVSQAFLEGLRSPKDPAVQVLKPVHQRDDDAIPLTDSGAVSLEDPEKIVSVIHGATAVKRSRRLLCRLQCIAAILAGVGIGILFFLGISHEITAPRILLWQALWLSVSLIATHVEVNTEKLHLLK